MDLYQELAQSGTESALPLELRFRIARRLERQGSLAQAEREYDKLHSGCLENEAAFQAILAHAALCVRQGRKADALELYQTAKEAIWAHLLLESTLQQGLRDARALPDESPSAPAQQGGPDAATSDSDVPDIESAEAPALILMDRSEPPATDGKQAAVVPTWPAPARTVPTPTLVSAGSPRPATPIETAGQAAGDVSSRALAAGAQALAPGAGLLPASLHYSHKPPRTDDAGRYSLRPASVVEVNLAETSTDAPRSSARASVRTDGHGGERDPGSRASAGAGRYSTSTPGVESIRTPKASLRSGSSSGAGLGTRKPTRDDLRQPTPGKRTEELPGVTPDPRRK